jgi:hypothetical protein
MADALAEILADALLADLLQYPPPCGHAAKAPVENSGAPSPPPS